MMGIRVHVSISHVGDFMYSLAVEAVYCICFESPYCAYIEISTENLYI